MGYVYLLLEVDKHGEERHKIGITKNDPKKRNRGLQTGNSDKICVLKFYESPNYLKIERILHRKFSVKTSAGNEWRNLTNEEVMTFLDECKKADDIVSLLIKENPFYL
jgi:hypothetical protein